MSSLSMVLVFILINYWEFTSSDFCEDYKKELKGEKSTPNLKFIPTKGVLYLYLNIASEENVYELNVNCVDPKNCPSIGSKHKLSDVFKGFSNMRMAYIQDGFTYLFPNKNASKIFKYENTTKKEEIEPKVFWKNISHSISYEWKDTTRTEIHRFLPMRSMGQLDSRYVFSHDASLDHSVELYGRFGSIYIRQTKEFYAFDEYFIYHKFYAYLPLPNGGALFNAKTPVLVRKEGINFVVYKSQDLYKFFGCDHSNIEQKILSDGHNDMIYPVVNNMTN